MAIVAKFLDRLAILNRADSIAIVTATEDAFAARAEVVEQVADMQSDLTQ